MAGGPKGANDVAQPLIFEGTDKAGKTTLLDAVLKTRRDWRQYARPRQIKDTKPTRSWMDAVEMDHTIVRDIMQLRNKFAVVDRVPHFSEPAYAKVVDGVDYLHVDTNLQAWERVDADYVRIGAIVVYCFAAPRVVETRWDRDPDPYMKREHIRPLQVEYLKLLVNSRLDIITINTAVCSPDYAAEQIVRFAEKGAHHQHETCGDRAYASVGTLRHHHGVPSGSDTSDSLDTLLRSLLS
jgi:hypothetical protein